MEKVDQERSINLTNLQIRPVKKEDLRALEWEGAYKKYRRMYADIFYNTFLQKSLMWVVELNGRGIIGQAFVILQSTSLDFADRDGKRRAYLFGLRIREAWRNLGVGSYLMGFIEGDLSKRGYQIITLNVAKENGDALRLYQRLGYKIVGSHAGKWSYVDDQGDLQHVKEPSWRMVKQIVEKI